MVGNINVKTGEMSIHDRISNIASNFHSDAWSLVRLSNDTMYGVSDSLIQQESDIYFKKQSDECRYLRRCSWWVSDQTVCLRLSGLFWKIRDIRDFNDKWGQVAVNVPETSVSVRPAAFILLFDVIRRSWPQVMLTSSQWHSSYDRCMCAQNICQVY